MAITVEQAWDGTELELIRGNGTNSSSSATIFYIVVGTEDDETACLCAYNQAPDACSSIPKKSVAISERLTQNSWKIEVRYGSEGTSSDGDSGDDDEATVNFDCSTGTKHVTQAIEQTCIYAGSGESKDSTDEASAVPIGWNGKYGSEAEAAGVDVSIGVLRETYTKYISTSTISSTTWKRKVAELVGKINKGSFKGWSAGEVMFLGCSYTAPIKGTQKVAVSFHFAINPNESNAVVAGQKIGKKEGFDYIWAISDNEIANGKTRRRVKKIYNAVVCNKASFTSLPLTSWRSDWSPISSF